MSIKTIIIIILIIVIFGGLVLWRFVFTNEQGNSSANSPSENRFGFLTGDDNKFAKVTLTGAGWVRPHPGPFIWGQMQPDYSSDPISFRDTDKLVKEAGNSDLSILVTLWPYNSSDQKERSNAESCQFEGEFNEEFGSYRCNPNNWSAYESWVTAVIERYDGDGINDMPNLPVKIKYWEVLNEPDLNFGDTGPKGSTLSFFIGGPGEYQQLLERTYRAIKQADPEAFVLLAGAAGSNNHSLEFYSQVLQSATARDSFDIANIHCISSGDYASLNVADYQKMLTDIGIARPIWVTEAETFISGNPVINATQLKQSSAEALSLGVAKIFYTSIDFLTPPGGNKVINDKQPISLIPDPTLPVSDPVGTYQAIINSL
ncbi:MAG: hypothetical protein V1838_00680 [Patescibacteria group bacterium]